jgi:Tfp pilus assembly pilus retraction ATPase PilT
MPTVRQMMETGSKEGMQTMDQGLASFVRKGAIAEEEALFRARDRDAFMRFLSAK